MKLPDDFQYPDGHIFNVPVNFESAEDKDTIINWLRSENAYLKGMIWAYEKFLKDKGFIKEEEDGPKKHEAHYL